MIKAASYTRKSSSTNKRQRNSHTYQLEEIERFSESYGYDLVEHFSDSKTGMNTNRDGWKAFIQFLEASPEHYGVMYRCDRAARTLKVFTDIEHLVDQLRFVQLGDTKPDLITLSVMFAIGRAESEANSQRTKSAYRSIKARNPNHPWGNPNISEISEKGSLTAQNNAEVFWLDLLEKEKALFRMGYTTRKSRINELNRLGYRTRRGKLLSQKAFYRAHKRLGTGT